MSIYLILKIELLFISLSFMMMQAKTNYSTNPYDTFPFYE